MTSMSNGVSAKMDELADETFHNLASINSEYNASILKGVVLNFSDPPSLASKPKRSRRVVIEWERHLRFLTLQPGRWIQVFELEGEGAREQAQHRARKIRNRLIKAKPGEIWEVVSDKYLDGSTLWGIWVRYVREATREEIDHRVAQAAAAHRRGVLAAERRKAKSSQS